MSSSDTPCSSTTLANSPTCDQIINIFPDPFVIIDRHYRIVAANKHYLKHYGHQTCAEVVGQFCYKISHHVDSPCTEHGEHCPLDQVFATAKATQVLHIHFDKQGGEEHVELQSTPLLDSDGEVLYVGEYIRPVAVTGDQVGKLVGRSPSMLRMINLLQRVAPTQTSVLLLGESGVGKECVASYLHQYSSRAAKELVIVDCGTLGENLIESELFGHEKGAFTGANARKIGLFETAHQGTLFIDEIAELPLPLQTKLLRVLESGTIRRIGGTQYIDVDVRIIAATNKDLQKMVENGEFRQDLYYRLSAFPIRIPALRERTDDIPILAEHFISRFEEGSRHLPLSAEVIEGLLAYDYPGNVRELRNILERAHILAYEDGLRPEHIYFEAARSEGQAIPADDYLRMRGADASKSSQASVTSLDYAAVDELGEDSQERLLKANAHLLSRRGGRLSDHQILSTLAECDGHRAQAAAKLGVSERTLYRHLVRIKGNQAD